MTKNEIVGSNRLDVLEKRNDDVYNGRRARLGLEWFRIFNLSSSVYFFLILPPIIGGYFSV